MKIIELSRLTRKLLEQIDLKKGNHDSRENGVCAMEAVAWLAGREHTDHPPCVCPIIGAFVRSWNDGLPNDEDRNRLLKPVLPKLIGTKSSPAVESKRADMIIDWLARGAAPASLKLAGLTAEAAAIQAAGSPDALLAALRSASSAANKKWDAARDAAWAAAWDAARAAAWDAARDAARAAAWDAAWDAARDAARDAAWAAARDAARDAAWAAARDAAREKLAPLIAAQQHSAQTLLISLTKVGAK